LDLSRFKAVFLEADNTRPGAVDKLGWPSEYSKPSFMSSSESSF
jgi:hypothetical protein